jgi:hypothetical protein
LVDTLPEPVARFRGGRLCRHLGLREAVLKVVEL